MNIRCPHCETLFRVDPARVPSGGARARCSRCEGIFPVAGERVEAGVAAGPASALEQPSDAAGPAQPATEAAQQGSQPAPAAAAEESRPIFGPQDPDERAQRFARALVSDIVAYHGERRDESLRAGTLKRDFREEILKSWEEYVLQVGEERAKHTPYFRDALNEILAQGQSVF